MTFWDLELPWENEMRNRYRMATSIEDAEAALDAIVDSEISGRGCEDSWRHQLTPVVKYCRVVVADRRPVLQVNPAWMRELMEQDRLWLLVDEIRTWDAINEAVSDAVAQGRSASGRKGRISVLQPERDGLWG